MKSGGTGIGALFLALGAVLSSCSHRPPVSPSPSVGTGTIIWDTPKGVNKPVKAVILFPFNVDTLTSKQVAGLKETAQKANRAGKAITITGSADTVGSEGYNLALGRRRALAVHLALTVNGCLVPLSVASYGEMKGIAAFSRKVTVK